jgi:hypothetical protein
MTSPGALSALFVILLAINVQYEAARADAWPQSTCVSYIRALDLSAQYNDPYLNQ